MIQDDLPATEQVVSDDKGAVVGSRRMSSRRFQTTDTDRAEEHPVLEEKEEHSTVLDGVTENDKSDLSVDIGKVEILELVKDTEPLLIEEDGLEEGTVIGISVPELAVDDAIEGNQSPAVSQNAIAPTREPSDISQEKEKIEEETMMTRASNWREDEVVHEDVVEDDLVFKAVDDDHAGESVETMEPLPRHDPTIDGNEIKQSLAEFGIAHHDDTPSSPSIPASSPSQAKAQSNSTPGSISISDSPLPIARAHISSQRRISTRLSIRAEEAIRRMDIAETEVEQYRPRSAEHLVLESEPVDRIRLLAGSLMRKTPASLAQAVTPKRSDPFSFANYTPVRATPSMVAKTNTTAYPGAPGTSRLLGQPNFMKSTASKASHLQASHMSGAIRSTPGGAGSVIRSKALQSEKEEARRLAIKGQLDAAVLRQSTMQTPLKSAGPVRRTYTVEPLLRSATRPGKVLEDETTESPVKHLSVMKPAMVAEKRLLESVNRKDVMLKSLTKSTARPVGYALDNHLVCSPSKEGGSPAMRVGNSAKKTPALIDTPGKDKVRRGMRPESTGMGMSPIKPFVVMPIKKSPPKKTVVMSRIPQKATLVAGAKPSGIARPASTLIRHGRVPSDSTTTLSTSLSSSLSGTQRGSRVPPDPTTVESAAPSVANSVPTRFRSIMNSSPAVRRTAGGTTSRQPAMSGALRSSVMGTPTRPAVHRPTAMGTTRPLPLSRLAFSRLGSSRLSSSTASRSLMTASTSSKLDESITSASGSRHPGQPDSPVRLESNDQFGDEATPVAASPVKAVTNKAWQSLGDVSKASGREENKSQSNRLPVSGMSHATTTEASSRPRRTTRTVTPAPVPVRRGVPAASKGKGKAPMAASRPVTIAHIGEKQLATITQNNTNRNEVYFCPMCIVVVHKDCPRPPSPGMRTIGEKEALLQKSGRTHRAKKRGIAEESEEEPQPIPRDPTKHVRGAGDLEDYATPDKSGKRAWKSQMTVVEGSSPNAAAIRRKRSRGASMVPSGKSVRWDKGLVARSDGPTVPVRVVEAVRIDPTGILKEKCKLVSPA